MLTENKNESIVSTPPVFLSLDDIYDQKKTILEGPWSYEVANFLQEEFERERIGVSADPRNGIDLDFNTEMALRSTPGNVEVGVLFKKGNNQQFGWEDVERNKFIDSASLFLDSPKTQPTIHAPVDVNWMGISKEGDKLRFSDDVRETELKWLEKEIPSKIRPFVNVIALKKEEGYVDQNFRIPIVFHSTPALSIYNTNSPDKPIDIMRTSNELLADSKSGDIIFVGDLEKIMESKGIPTEPLRNTYVPLRPDGEKLEDHYNFHLELVDKSKELNYEISKDTFTKEDISLYLDRIKSKNKLIDKLNEELDNNFKSDMSKKMIELSKLKDVENVINDLYEHIKEIKEDKIINERGKINEKIKNLFEKYLPKIIGDSHELMKLEESGVPHQIIREAYNAYAELKNTFKVGTREEIEEKSNKMKEKINDLYEKLKDSKDLLLPNQKNNILVNLDTLIKDAYKRLGYKEEIKKLEKMEEELKNKNDLEGMYNLLSNQVKNLLETVKNKKLVDIKPAENVALEKASDTIAEFAKKLIKDPLIKDNAFIAIENFFPEDFFGGKIDLNGKKEWAMKALLEKSREKFIEKLTQEENINEEEAKKLAEEFIGMTLDMGHFNLWRSRGKLNDEKFTEMAIDFLENVKPFVKHIHLTDNPGTADTHQEIGTGNVPNDLTFKILKEEFEKRGINPTITIEWGGPQGLANKQPSNYENWRIATVPAYGKQALRAYSTLYHSFSYKPSGGIYYKDESHLTSWLI